MTVYKTQIFEPNTKVYIDHFAGDVSARAEYRQSFTPDTTITSIKMYHLVTKIEVWDIFGRYWCYTNEEFKEIGFPALGMIIKVNGKEVLNLGAYEILIGVPIEVSLTEDEVHLDGSLNTIEVIYRKVTYGNSNSYQIWFESWIEVAADKAPTETTVDITPTTTREDVEPITTSYEMAGQLIQFMMMFMTMTIILNLISYMIEGLTLG